jgi:pimeloyl-ACP methyl ester carboxylesterase
MIMATYESFIKKWPVTSNAIIVPTRYGDTFVISSGKETSSPLVLIHGASSNSASWAGEVKAYSEHFHVFAVDVIGEPGKSSQTRPPWEGSSYADWMNDVIEGLYLKNIMLLGISQGGWIALKYAISKPHNIKKLVLLSPAGVVPTKTSFILKAIIYSILGSWGANKLNQYVFGKEKMDSIVLKVMNEIMTYFIPRIEKEYIFTDDELKQLKNIQTLFIGGEKDVIRPVDKIDARLNTYLNHLSTILLPDRGHVLINLADKIIPFLQRK